MGKNGTRARLSIFGLQGKIDILTGTLARRSAARRAGFVAGSRALVDGQKNLNSAPPGRGLTRRKKNGVLTPGTRCERAGHRRASALKGSNCSRSQPQLVDAQRENTR